MIHLYVYGDGGVSDDVRLRYPITHIKQDESFKFKMASGTISEGTKLPIDDKGIYIFSRPVSNLEGAIVSLKNEHKNVKIIADLDDSFWDIPTTHIAYNSIGPKSDNIKSLERNLKRVDAIVASTETLKKRIEEKTGRQDVIVIPNVCNSDNPYLALKRPSKQLRFGFSGTITHRDDFKIMLKPLIQFISETNDVKIVMAVDSTLYRLLSSIPEKKKMFVPAYPYKYYPIQLSYMDILLIPLVNDAFNRAKSHIKLLDAVANKKPFIASDVEPYHPYGQSDSSEWAGLVVSNDSDSWYSAMKYMLSEKNRQAFISAGDAIKSKMNVSLAANMWKEVIQGVLS